MLPSEIHAFLDVFLDSLECRQIEQGNVRIDMFCRRPSSALATEEATSHIYFRSAAISVVYRDST